MSIKTKRTDKQFSHEPPKLNLIHQTPITDNQRKTFTNWANNHNMMLHGVASTGKTFIGFYLGIDKVMHDTKYEKLYIVRSTVSGRDMGHMPGGYKEKINVFEAPYYEIASKLFERKDAYNSLKLQGKIEFISTSFLRGVTFENCIVLVDEVQNMNNQELHTIMTRIGENCKIIFAGDMKQDDLTNPRYREYSGLSDFMLIIKAMPEFSFIEFTIDDIVRSKLVKSYIIQRELMMA